MEINTSHWYPWEMTDEYTYIFPGNPHVRGNPIDAKRKTERAIHSTGSFLPRPFRSFRTEILYFSMIGFRQNKTPSILNVKIIRLSINAVKPSMVPAAIAIKRYPDCDRIIKAKIFLRWYCHNTTRFPVTMDAAEIMAIKSSHLISSITTKELLAVSNEFTS